MLRVLLVVVLSLCVYPAHAQSKKPAAKPKVTTKTRKPGEPMPREEVDRHREFLLKGVDEISTAGIPGPLVVYGPNAFPVVIDQRDGQTIVMFAAATHGRGRMVALPHDGYLGALLTEHAGTARLIQNSLLWAAGLDEGQGAGLRVAVRGYDSFQKQLASANVPVKKLPDQGWANQLAGANVVVADIYHATPNELQSLDRFVRSGGGLVTPNLIWGWQQNHIGDDPRTDHGGNRFFSQVGIAWADGYCPAASGAKVPITVPLQDYMHVGWALEAVEAAGAGQRTLDADDWAILASTLRNLTAISRQGNDAFFNRIEGILTSNGDKTPIPGAKTPVPRQNAEARMLVSLEAAYYQEMPVEQLKPHPAAASFPGEPVAEAPRVTRRLEIDLSQYGWKSTGLYAAPGERISIKVDPAAVNQGFVVQIGCHTDLVWSADNWHRTPEMVRRFPVRRAVMNVGHALGGSIYIIAPEKIKGGRLQVEIGNAVEAPYFVLGRTTLDDWQKTFKNHPAPWAELECDRVIISVPSDLVRELDDPQAVMTHWRAALDACADLRAMNPIRRKPERFVFDRQLSLGFLHAGYPIMAHIDPSGPQIVDLRFLRTHGGWGFYHELGHNHQLPEWTFDGTLEVTCNWFSLYLHEVLTPGSNTHENVQPAFRDRLEREYIQGGASFEKWKGDAFLALVMYQQLRDEFGWVAFKRVLAEYQDLPAEARPKTEIEKHDQWMVRFSRVVGKNLGPFFQYWGIPTSDAARQSISGLPVWMPEGRPLK